MFPDSLDIIIVSKRHDVEGKIRYLAGCLPGRRVGDGAGLTASKTDMVSSCVVWSKSCLSPGPSSVCVLSLTTIRRLHPRAVVAGVSRAPSPHFGAHFLAGPPCSFRALPPSLHLSPLHSTITQSSFYSNISVPRSCARVHSTRQPRYSTSSAPETPGLLAEKV